MAIPCLLAQVRLMGPPNLTWQQIIQQASASPEILKQQEIIRNVQNILQTNVSVCQVGCCPALSIHMPCDAVCARTCRCMASVSSCSPHI